MKRILTIDKCADCNIENCKLRTLCGLIPNKCPLCILVEDPSPSWDDAPNWDDAPEWANWLTYDKDGWFWWDAKPDLYDGVYLMNSDGFEMNSAEFPIPNNVTRAIYGKPDFPVPGKVTRAIYGKPESPKEVSK